MQPLTQDSPVLLLVVALLDTPKRRLVVHSFLQSRYALRQDLSDHLRFLPLQSPRERALTGNNPDTYPCPRHSDVNTLCSCSQSPDTDHGTGNFSFCPTLSVSCQPFPAPRSYFKRRSGHGCSHAGEGYGGMLRTERRTL